MEHDGGLDLLIEELGGCGRFQMILVSLLFLAEMPAAFSMILMVFGNYNPGWRCLDNVTVANNTNWETQDCSKYTACQNVEFNPESSTIITEWDLLCDRQWISSVIISVQMVGILVGAYLTGYLGDKIGRKLTFCFTVLMTSLSNFISYFSTSWQMFAVMRFCIGMTYSCMTLFPFILASEFSSSKWRSVIASLPTWSVGAILFATSAMILRDWRQIQLITAIITGIFFLPTLWVPESIRWLTVKCKREKVFSVTKKIAEVNRKPIPEMKDFAAVMENAQKHDRKSRKYSWRHLWKGEACKRTAIFTPLWFTIALIYYVLSFGIKSLSGDFYTNLMIFYALEFPVFFLAAYTPNLLGRKTATLCHSVLITVCLFVIVGFDRLGSPDTKGLAILVLVMLIKVAASSNWYILQIFMAELYPTVIRTTCLGYGGVIARVGGIVAPYLIPNDPDTYFISYTVMAVLILISSLLVLLLPETKGTQLTDTWDINVVTTEYDSDTNTNASPKT